MTWNLHVHKSLDFSNDLIFPSLELGFHMSYSNSWIISLNLVNVTSHKARAEFGNFVTNFSNWSLLGYTSDKFFLNFIVLTSQRARRTDGRMNTQPSCLVRQICARASLGPTVCCEEASCASDGLTWFIGIRLKRIPTPVRVAVGFDGKLASRGRFFSAAMVRLCERSDACPISDFLVNVNDDQFQKTSWKVKI